jgi:shikimate dehydrogenase
MNLVLIGMPGCGKSTIGVLLAKSMLSEFVDTDLIIQNKHKKSLCEIISEDGLENFKETENEVLSEINCENCVIATGGGAVLRAENLSALKQSGKIYFIDRPLSGLIPTEDRPLSRDRSALEELYNQRYPVYCEVCDVRIDADCDANSVSEKILENLK